MFTTAITMTNSSNAGNVHDQQPSPDQQQRTAVPRSGISTIASGYRSEKTKKADGKFAERGTSNSCRAQVDGVFSSPELAENLQARPGAPTSRQSTGKHIRQGQPAAGTRRTDTTANRAPQMNAMRPLANLNARHDRRVLHSAFLQAHAIGRVSC